MPHFGWIGSASPYLHVRNLTLDCLSPEFVRVPFCHQKDLYLASILPDPVWRACRKQLIAKDILFLSQVRDHTGEIFYLDFDVPPRRFSPDPKWLIELRRFLCVDDTNWLKPELCRLATSSRPERRPATAHTLPQLLLEHSAPLPRTAAVEPSPRTWWTDGSLDARRTTGGSACTDGQTTLKGSLRAPDGTLSSTSAELGAILLGLRNTPANQQIDLISDSQATLAIVSQPLTRHTRHALKKPDLHLRACIQALLSNRTAPFTTTWVCGQVTP
jgi:hypothetical protein